MRIQTLAAVAALAISGQAAAQTAVTTLDNSPAPPTSDGTTFTAPTGELRPTGSPTSSATITSDPSLSANGSLELDGLRTRVYNDMTGLAINADTLVSLTADYLVNNGGSDGIQSPAFRVYVRDANGGISELVWEAAYNGGYTAGVADSVLPTDQFWRWVVGQGYDGTTGISSGSYVFNTLEGWGNLLGGTVLGVGAGNGGCPSDCTSFNALADNLTLTTDRGIAGSYDFQVAAAAVPEPGTWAMMLIGFGGIGYSMRKARRVKAIPQVA